MTNNTAVRLRRDCAKLLFAILEQGQSSRHVLSDLQSQYADARDKAWLQEMAFGCLRQLPTLQFWLRQLLQKPLKGNKKVIEHLLMVGLYQLAYSRVSEHAAISETVNACKSLQADKLRGLVNAILREFQRSDLREQKPDNPAAQAGMANWIYKSLAQAYPEQLDTIIEATNAKAPLWLRVNSQQTQLATFCLALEEKGIGFQTTQEQPDAVILDQYADVTALPGYDAGWFAVQDGAAQLAVDYLQPQAGDRILDCCAAPGGKTCHILERQPNIDCTALDNDEYRLERVSANLKRLKHSASIVCGDASKPEDWWNGQKFDRILLDAPCSATGVIRRHPDIRWLRKQSDIDVLVGLQAQILENLWPLLKAGGTLLYATCSILPRENHQQIERFLSEHADATLDNTMLQGSSPHSIGRQILPGEQQMDGFYYARLLKSKR